MTDSSRERRMSPDLVESEALALVEIDLKNSDNEAAKNANKANNDDSSNLDNNDKNLQINKLPTIKKAKLAPKQDTKKRKARRKKDKTEKGLLGIDKHFVRPKRAWKETKVYYLPPMPTEQDEKDVFIEKEFHCFFCDDLCDEANLECKTCGKVCHITCLHNRGYLHTTNIPLKSEWACCDCSDLSKILYDEEMRKLIITYEKLDAEKDSYVRFEDYMAAKQQIYEENFEEMTPELELQEERHFHFMDYNNYGFITWNSFIEFEAANLLSKRNKIELSNYLTKKELVVTKKKFLSYDTEKISMISRDDARQCYADYITKLSNKIGPAFAEHIHNCFDMFGLDPNVQEKINLSKTIWPEFLRKMTILILFDRINPISLRPKIFKPYLGEKRTERKPVRRVSTFENEISFQEREAREREQKEAAQKFREAKMNELNTKYQLLLPSLEKKSPDDEIKNGIMDVRKIMGRPLDNFKINRNAHFGSSDFVIRASEAYNERGGSALSSSGSADLNVDEEELENALKRGKKGSFDSIQATAPGFRSIKNSKRAAKVALPVVATSNDMGTLPAVANKYRQPLTNTNTKAKLTASTNFNVANLIRERKNSRQSFAQNNDSTNFNSQPVNYFSYNKDYYNNYDKIGYSNQAGSNQIASILSFKPKMNLLFNGVNENVLNAASSSSRNVIYQQPQQQHSTAIKSSYKDGFQLPNLIEETGRNNIQKYIRNKMF